MLLFSLAARSFALSDAARVSAAGFRAAIARLPAPADAALEGATRHRLAPSFAWAASLCRERRGHGADRTRHLAAAIAASVLPNWAVAKDENGAADAPAAKAPPETLVKQLYDSLGEKQRKDVAFDWDYEHPKMGLLRTRIF